MKKIRPISGIIFCGIFSAIFLIGCSESQTIEDRTIANNSSKIIKIGVITPMSGDAAAVGEEARKVLDYELPLVNKKYQSTDYQFDLVYEDGKCAGSNAVTAFQKLTDIDGIKFIIGGTCSSESLGIAPLLVDKQVVALSGWSSSPELVGKSSYLFSLSYSDDGVARGIADELGKYNKVAIISEQNDYNQAMKKNVEKVLKEKYPSTIVVNNEEYPKGGTDFRNQLQKIQATNPDVVFLNPNIGVTAEAMIKQLAEMKDWHVQKVSPFALMGDTILKISPKTLEGTIIVDAPKINSPEFTSIINKIIAKKGKLDNLGNYYTASSLDALDILAKLIVENNGNSEKVRTALSTENLIGNLGNLSFNGQTFVQGIGVAKFIIRDGQAVPL